MFGQRAALQSVACISREECVAVGGYQTTYGTAESDPTVSAESAGVWGQAFRIGLPSDAGDTGPHSGHDAVLDSVACTGPGQCVAVGYYFTTLEFEPMVATESDGVWGQASKLALPANANRSPGRQAAALQSVTCSGQDACVAV